MGFGGAGKQAQQMQQQNAMMQAQMQQQESQFMQQEQSLATSQAARLASQQSADAQMLNDITSKFTTAQQQTPQGQAAAKLGILDFIHTSPQGLLNQPKTGRLTLLGN